MGAILTRLPADLAWGRYGRLYDAVFTIKSWAEPQKLRKKVEPSLFLPKRYETPRCGRRADEHFSIDYTRGPFPHVEYNGNTRRSEHSGHQENAAFLRTPAAIHSRMQDQGRTSCSWHGTWIVPRARRMAGAETQIRETKASDISVEIANTGGAFNNRG